MVKRAAAILLTLTVVTSPSYAWNASGHKAIALIAYNQLSGATRAKVYWLLSRYPDCSQWITGTTGPDRGSTAFIAASVWADSIRSDPRFHDDNRTATPDIPGLPPGAQARHAT